MAERTITLEVFRYRPDTEQEPTFQSYTVPIVKTGLSWMPSTI
jgi:succinate dehydrogenase/fumarate reductase-like Fe-S protein